MHTLQLVRQVLRDEGIVSLAKRVALRTLKRLRYAGFRVRRRMGLVRRGQTPASIAGPSIQPEDLASITRIWQLSQCRPLRILVPDALYFPLCDMARHAGQPQLQPVAYSQAPSESANSDFDAVLLRRSILHRLPIEKLRELLTSWTGIFGVDQTLLLANWREALPDPVAQGIQHSMRRTADELCKLQAGGLLRTSSQGTTLRCHYSSSDLGIVEQVAARYFGWADIRLEAHHVVVDAGANLGAFAVACGQRCRSGRVIALEACRDNFELLCENIARNCPLGAQAVHCAVHRDTTPRRLYLDADDSGGHSLLAARRSAGTEMVECIDLAGVLRLAGGKIDVLKVDVEGSEYDFLLPAAELLVRHVQTLVVEAHPHPRWKPADLAGRLAALGYRVRTKGHPRLLLIHADRPTSALASPAGDREPAPPRDAKAA